MPTNLLPAAIGSGAEIVDDEPIRSPVLAPIPEQLRHTDTMAFINEEDATFIVMVVEAFADRQ